MKTEAESGGKKDPPGGRAARDPGRAMDSPPARLLDRLGKASLVVEVGAGRRFDVALVFARAGHRVVVTDVDPRVLEAPPPLAAVVDDVFAPVLERFRGASLVYAVRPPEEIQLALARFARAVGAELALRPLAGEIVDVSTVAGPAFTIDGWRLHAPPRRS